jgi:hypothetical protein
MTIDNLPTDIRGYTPRICHYKGKWQLVYRKDTLYFHYAYNCYTWEAESLTDTITQAISYFDSLPESEYYQFKF